ncbi:MAG TPA: hypothetical protein VKZ41_01815 [Gemmatimonadales bacterium]|nr:hypothetical protein [Gemmatimonadales bacterium]
MTSDNDAGMNAGGAGFIDQASAPLDAPVRKALRDMHAPPRDEAYWDGLEERIMARVLGRTSAEWWQVMAEWSRTAAMAAAVAIIVATALLVSVEQRDEASFAAYEAVVNEALAFSYDVEPESREPDVNERALPGVLPH